MQFRELLTEDLQPALQLAELEYRQERLLNNQLPEPDSGLTDRLKELLAGLCSCPYRMAAFENGRMIGYLAFLNPRNHFHGKVKGVFSPLGGSALSGEDRGRTASMLFEKIAERAVTDGIASFAVSRFAHDTEVIGSFVLNGFGIRCCDAILRTAEAGLIRFSYPGVKITELNPADKSPAVNLHRKLAEHLAGAPIFLPFDSRSLNDWRTDEKIRVFAAMKEERAVGYMALTQEAETFLAESGNTINICGAYVEDSFRSKGIAEMLLSHICNWCVEHGIEYLGVDCETLNPAALRFWRKYFTPYTYSYVRRIDERIMDIPKSGKER